MHGSIMPQVGASATPAVGSAVPMDRGASHVPPVFPFSTVLSHQSASSASFCSPLVSSPSSLPVFASPFCVTCNVAAGDRVAGATAALL